MTGSKRVNARAKLLKAQHPATHQLQANAG
jgi:hypothetical protein